ncbi:BA14K family protein [Bartonella sp. CB178]|uniref:BA14K family protein n=1 Tax=Bartonella sp. CB178 TaxID=3112255 RepID=UPI00300DFE47
MEKFTKLAVLSVVSAAAVLAPLGAVFAGTKSIFDERFTRTTIISPSYPGFDYTHPIQTQTHIRREQHSVHREQKTHSYAHTEHHGHVNRKYIHNYYTTRNDSGDTLAAGILGLAAGALLGNALKKNEQPKVVYQVSPQPTIIYQAPPSIVYQTVQQPLASGWLQYCKEKYRSFNPETGTFKGRDGKDHFCYAPVMPQ